MELINIVVGSNETNTYLLYDTETLEAFIIDPGDEESKLVQSIDKKSLKLAGIILTHYHHDHIGVAEELRKRYQCPIYAHKKEFEGLSRPDYNRSIGARKNSISIIPDKALSDGDEISIGKITLLVIHTPGHTPGGICLGLKNSKIVFTGDTIFEDDLGRTDLEGGCEDQLKRSIANKVSKWPEDTIIYPGHGASATIKQVRERGVPYL